MKIHEVITNVLRRSWQPLKVSEIYDIAENDYTNELEKFKSYESWTLQSSFDNILQKNKLFDREKWEDWIYKYFIKDTNSLLQKKSSLLPNSQNMEKLTSQESLLLLSLLTKPFSILYWVSWTWKSRVVKELWRKIYWDNYETYFHKEAVPPNWFDDSEIIWRYNEIEKYQEWSFVKHLEKAIKDPSNNYVYLLDEMNLSHIEQYLAQYLSAVEDLEAWNAWINVWKIERITIWKIEVENKIIEEDNLLEEDITGEEIEDYFLSNSLENKIFLKWSFFINWKEINYNSGWRKDNHQFSFFTKEIIKYIIDNYSSDIEKFWFNRVEQLKEEKFSRIGKKWENWEEWEEYNNTNINELISKLNNEYKEKGCVLHIDKSEKHLFVYWWYYIENDMSPKSRLTFIKELVSKISPETLKWLKITFINKGKKLEERWSEWNCIVEYRNNGNNDQDTIWKSLKLPKNFFVVWTINLDETTKSISPKVVDRANLIEFNDLDNYLFIIDTNKYDIDFLNNLNIPEIYDDIIKIRNNDNSKISEENKKLLQNLYDFLKLFKLHFSYRTLNEILTFIAIWKELWVKEEDKLLDIAIMQKILPKLNWVIDSCFNLYNDWKYLTYDIEDKSLFSAYKELLTNWIIDSEKFPNTSKKLQRMQQFFDNYQNVNYFLS